MTVQPASVQGLQLPARSAGLPAHVGHDEPLGRERHSALSRHVPQERILRGELLHRGARTGEALARARRYEFAAYATPVVAAGDPLAARAIAAYLRNAAGSHRPAPIIDIRV